MDRRVGMNARERHDRTVPEPVAGMKQPCMLRSGHPIHERTPDRDEWCRDRDHRASGDGPFKPPVPSSQVRIGTIVRRAVRDAASRRADQSPMTDQMKPMKMKTPAKRPTSAGAPTVVMGRSMLASLNLEVNTVGVPALIGLFAGIFIFMGFIWSVIGE